MLGCVGLCKYVKATGRVHRTRASHCEVLSFVLTFCFDAPPQVRCCGVANDSLHKPSVPFPAMRRLTKEHLLSVLYMTLLIMRHPSKLNLSFPLSVGLRFFDAAFRLALLMASSPEEAIAV